jgi:hypothetical protein
MLSDSGEDAVLMLVIAVIVVGLLSAWTSDAEMLVPDMAQQGLYVECGRTDAPTNDCCVGGQGLYLYLYPVPDRIQLPA